MDSGYFLWPVNKIPLEDPKKQTQNDKGGQSQSRSVAEASDMNS